MPFSVGDSVKWSSQSQGETFWKIGKVVAIVPRNMTLWRFFMSFDVKSYNIRQVSSAERDRTTRPHESYLVSVVVYEEKAGKPLLYWPRVSSLMLADEFGIVREVLGGQSDAESISGQEV